MWTSPFTPIDVDDQTWLYFTGTTDRHGWCGVGADRRQWRKEAHDGSGFARIGLATWQKNGLLGYRSLYTERVTLSLPTDAPNPSGNPPRLLLNAKTEKKRQEHCTRSISRRHGSRNRLGRRRLTSLHESLLRTLVIR